MFLAADTAQVQVTVNDVLGTCIGSCGYEFISNQPEIQIKSLITTTNFHFRSQIAHPYLELICSNCNDKSKLKALDTWIARKILKQVFKKGGDRVFRYYPYSKLRSNGLKSLQHLCNIRNMS